MTFHRLGQPDSECLDFLLIETVDHSFSYMLFFISTINNYLLYHNVLIAKPFRCFSRLLSIGSRDSHYRYKKLLGFLLNAVRNLHNTVPISHSKTIVLKLKLALGS